MTVGVALVVAGLVMVTAAAVWLAGPWGLLGGGLMFVAVGLFVPEEVTSAKPHRTPPRSPRV